jgi:cytochrome o ubiquinol oxidase subunit 3
MHNEMTIENERHPDQEHDHHHYDADSTDVFGFWLYIMTDCVLFGCLFATFLVLNFPGAPGPDLKTYLSLPDVLLETFVLLASNFTFCLSILNFYQSKIIKIQAWLAVSFLLGASFVFIELKEFIHLANEGFKWDVSGKASSFFTLVGTHGLHVSCGLLWILIMIIQLQFIKDRHVLRRRMTYLGLFWNFLDIVWIFVFTIVYLMGAM